MPFLKTYIYRENNCGFTVQRPNHNLINKQVQQQIYPKRRDCEDDLKLFKMMIPRLN